MITKPRAFIYRLNRLKDEAVMLDSSKVVSIEIDSDLNKRCVIVKSSDSSIFDGNGDTVTYSFITCMNYRGPFIDKFWRMYMQNVDSIMPSTWKEKRGEICQNHNLLQYSEGDCEITTNRCFIDMVMARKYVDSDGIYTFEFIPVIQYIFSKAPLIILCLVITIPLGVKAVCIGSFVTSFICFFINAYLPGKMFGYGAWQQIKDWKFIFLSLAVMAMLVLAIMYCINNIWMQLIIGGLLGTASYLGCCYLFGVIDNEMIQIIKTRRL